jgi:hypothetical protein
MEKTKDQEWEEARQDAWLRQMLSDTSSDEDEESCGRFAESGRWISELFKISQHSATISGGERGEGNLEGGGLSKGWNREGQFTSNLRLRWTDPVTARRVPSK